MTVDYRELHGIAEFEQVADLEIAIWGSSQRDAVPSHMMHAVSRNGGLVVGAYAAAELVGMALAFPARRGRRWLLWSHMAGVRADYQGQSVGFGLKQYQRTWALERGYNTIGWTYDPLQRGNANFNLHLLGAVSSVYHVDFYGEMTDAINAGLPSDRLEVEWKLRDRRVRSLARGQCEQTLTAPPPLDAALLAGDGSAGPVVLPRRTSGPFYVEAPYNLSSLKQNSPALALQWRLALREVLVTAFADGFVATDFLTCQGRGWYVLTAPSQWYVYLLECADGTLYTGITTDLMQRVHRHNMGRGAAYTAVRRPVKLKAAWCFPDRSAALKAEAGLKRRPRQFKLELIQNQSAYEGQPFVELS